MAESNYLASYSLKIDGQDAAAQLIRDIQEIVVESSLYQPAAFTLIINNDYFPGTAAGPWQYQDLFAIGKAIEIGLSTATTEDAAFAESERATVILGEIAAIEADFNESSQATMTVRGYDISHRLYRGRHSRSFQNKKDSDIIKDIARETGIPIGKIDDTGGPHGYEDINDASGYVFQHNQTNMEFLRGRAARHGFELFVEGGKLYFRKPTSGQTLALKWLQDFQKFQVRVTSSEQVNDTEVRAWDYNQKQALIAQKSTPSNQVITANEFGQGRNTSSAFNGQPNSPTLQVVNQTFFSQPEGESIAQALCDETARDFIQVEATASGNPRLFPGKAISLTEMGKYSGTYYLTRVRHHLVEGRYTTDFSVGGIRGAELGPMLTPPAQGGGTMPLIGVVSNNQDPKGWGRVRVKFPTLTEEHESYWARTVGAGAGPNRGWDILPEVNDEVLVCFEGGDIHRPFIVGGLWNGKDAPPAAVADSVVDGKVRLRTFKTRTGHLLQFVDEAKDAQKQGVYIKSVFGHEIQANDLDKSITIKTPNGYSLVLDEANKQIAVKTQGGHTIVLDDRQQQIQVKGGPNAITLKTTSGEINIQAGAKIALSAPQIEISATASLDLKGGAIVKVNGAAVKIN